MTTEQALIASQGAAVRPSDRERHRRTYRRAFIPLRTPNLVVEHHLAGATFQAYLLFDAETRKLTCVDLIPKPGVPLTGALRVSLTETLGQPSQSRREQLPGLEWTVTTWITDHDTIVLQQGGLGAKLQYCERGVITQSAQGE
ncbi:MAG TPA: hypothetical protein VK196_11945 [Magnetospirillum sp.]|nr:hypothetical protein [Magnetospirillum sp.]